MSGGYGNRRRRADGCAVSVHVDWTVRGGVVAQERGGAGPAEVTLQERGRHLQEIDKHQAVQSISETRIDAESEYPSIELQILAQEDRESTAFDLTHKSFGVRKRCHGAGLH